MKSEPGTFSIDDLSQQPGQRAVWDGVRNYQARNFIRAMQVGDLAFFYHSSCAEPAIVGYMEIIKASYPDATAWDRNSDDYVPSSCAVWCCVDVQLLEKFTVSVPLKCLRKCTSLSSLPLLKRGNRLSIMPLTFSEWRSVFDLMDCLAKH